LTLVGGGVSAIIAAAWAAYTHFAQAEQKPPKEPTATVNPTINANQTFENKPNINVQPTINIAPPVQREPKTTIEATYVVCIGEDERRCKPHSAFIYCGHSLAA